jgi:predicted metal-dependent peptidase
MDARDMIIRARIQIQRKNPFFAYLSLFLKPREAAEGELPDYAGMGVDVQGNLVYNKKFVEGLSDKEIQGVLIHEILHLAYLHLQRRRARHPQGWNIAADIAVNQIVMLNDYDLPDGCLKPENNQIELRMFKTKPKLIIKDIDKKTAEDIYGEFPDEDMFSEDGQPYYDGQFDEHKDEVKSGLSEEEKRQAQKDWQQRVEEAFVASKMKGDVPAGIERLMGDLHKSKVNYRSLLRKYITSYIPYDYTYERPNKKSVAYGFYVPDYMREKITVCVCVDCSGSIGGEEYNEFLSEILSMAKSFEDRIELHFIAHDTQVHDDYHIFNGNVEKIKQIKVHGGGGTSHVHAFDYIQEKFKDCKVALFFTDGYSDLESIDFNGYDFAKIFLISQNGDARSVNGKDAHVIKLEKGDFKNND